MHTALERIALAAAIACGTLAFQPVHAADEQRESAPHAITERRPAGAFSAIELSGPYDVVIRAQSATGLSVTGERKQIDGVETFVRGDTLVAYTFPDRLGLAA